MNQPAPPADRPVVSVIIPTRRRPHLVARAVHSALAQTMADIEVIVVIDGPDPESEKALAAIGDGRVRIVRLPRRFGSGGARNTGVAVARGAWIAFLDDDDQWFPPKIERQLEAARCALLPLPIVGCRLIVRQVRVLRLWPRRVPAPGEDIAEYLFCRRGLFWGEGLLQTSMILAATALLRRVPFSCGPEAVHDDLGWIIRATRISGAGIVFVTDPAPLAIWHMVQSEGRLSSRTDWRQSLAWIRRMRPLVSRRAYAGFLLTYIKGHFRRLDAIAPLMREAARHGAPRPLDWLVFALNWSVPARLQQTLAVWFGEGVRWSGGIDGATDAPRPARPLRNRRSA